MYNRVDSPGTCNQSIILIGSMHSTQMWFFDDQIDHQIESSQSQLQVFGLTATVVESSTRELLGGTTGLIGELWDSLSRFSTVSHPTHSTRKPKKRKKKCDK
jgi:hypothetical protein